MSQQPCHNCPFRSDIAPYLHPERYLTIENPIALVNDAFATARDCSEQHKHDPSGPYLSI